MIENKPLYQNAIDLELENAFPGLLSELQKRYSNSFHGDFEKWRGLINELPKINPSVIDLDASVIRVGTEQDLSLAQPQQIEKILRGFHPWRKGPFALFGIYIDTEWRSDWKWDRLKHAITPLTGRRVLDIGCGNGYHCWRMRGAGAEFVLGIDPTVVFVMQYHAIQHYINDPMVQVLPLGIENMANCHMIFDTVFSMGILYHRRDPLAYLRQLGSFLETNGELVLETLIIEGGPGDVLESEGRYAQMRNVWQIPSVPTLESWLAESGYRNIHCVDVTKTTIEEQRVTGWMQYQSLKDYLDPDDPDKTMEGYPAPIRAVVIARK